MPVRMFWNSQLGNARDNVVRGKMTPEQALQEAQDATQKELDKVLGKA
jgi:maltose-binding protein MalE